MYKIHRVSYITTQLTIDSVTSTTDRGVFQLSTLPVLFSLEVDW